MKPTADSCTNVSLKQKRFLLTWAVTPNTISSDKLGDLRTFSTEFWGIVTRELKVTMANVPANPYTPPQTTSPPHNLQSGSTLRSIFAVLAGALFVAFLGRYVATLIVTVTAMPFPKADEWLRRLYQSEYGLLFFQVQAIIFAALGGWVTAIIARRKHVLHAFFTASLLTFLQRLVDGPTLSFFDLVPIGLCFSAAIMAGWLVGKRMNSEE